jgi:hypothetical protein
MCDAILTTLHYRIIDRGSQTLPQQARQDTSSSLGCLTAQRRKTLRAREPTSHA